MEFTVGERTVDVEQTEEGVLFDGQLKEMDVQRIDAHRYHVMAGDRSTVVLVDEVDHASKTVRLTINGKTTTITGKDRYAALLESLGMSAMTSNKADVVKAPMPGLVLEVLVSAGQEVKKGDKLLILEAMKMENVIKSPEDGVVKAVGVEKGVSVEKGDRLVVFA